MKRHMAIAVILTLALSALGIAMQASPSESFMGEIASVDTTAKTLTVKDTSAGEPSPRTMTFRLDAQSKIQRSSPGEAEPADLTLEDLEAGQQVNVTYVGQEGDYVARTIEVHAKPTT